MNQREFSELLESEAFEYEDAQIEMLKKELDYNGHISIIKICKAHKIKYGTSPYEEAMERNITQYIASNLAAGFVRGYFSHNVDYYMNLKENDSVSLQSLMKNKDGLLYNLMGHNLFIVDNELLEIFLQYNHSLRGVMETVNTQIDKRRKFEKYVSALSTHNKFKGIPFKTHLHDKDLGEKGMMQLSVIRDIIYEVVKFKSEVTFEEMVETNNACTMAYDPLHFQYSYLLKCYSQPFYETI